MSTSPEQEIHVHQLDNGLTLVMEPMRSVRSAAFSLRVPMGSVYDPQGANGTAAVLCDLLTRGAGDRDSQQLSNALDNLGVQRHESVNTAHIGCSGALLADNLEATLPLYADILRRPHLPEDQFAPALVGVEQSLRSIEDEPQQKVIVELKRRAYDAPWGRPTDGSLEELPNVTLEGVRRLYQRCIRPNGAIFGFAGRIDVDRLIERVESLFGDWQQQPEPDVPTVPAEPVLEHVAQKSAQTHIGIAFPAVPYRDPAYYAAWAAVNVLSGGSSSRLWTEVREKRGLCYSVYATLSSLREQARVLAYAGTTPERAQETLDVMFAEFARLQEGIEVAELARCQARAKSTLVMQQESTIARASSVARDWYLLGRVKTLAEVRGEIEALTAHGVAEYVRTHPPRDFTVLTIGPEPLETPGAVSPDTTGQ